MPVAMVLMGFVGTRIHDIMMNIKYSHEYRLIQSHYADRVARRSGVPLINHIDEGLSVLDAISATDNSKRAFCIHPLLQRDEDLALYYQMVTACCTSDVVLLAMEYRNVANRWLSDSALSPDPPALSPLQAVNDMLIADKVQNRKDFLRYHQATHERSSELTVYFTRWLDALDISSETYQILCKRIDDDRS